jgi:spermidine/putrescine transport system substrate-binding protein
MSHPRERVPEPTHRSLSRRDFLRRTAGAAVALPSLGVLLDACTKPGSTPTGGSSVTVGTGGISSAASPYPLARQDKPVTWNIFDDNPAIKSGLQPEKNAVLQIYNWDQYVYKPVVQRFCQKYGCTYKITTFENMDEALSKMQKNNGLNFDVFFPTIDTVGKLVAGKLILPLNKDYIPNLAAQVWPVYSNPYYDQKAQYTVPYTVYTTGIGYRRDVIPDAQIRGMSNPYDILWDPTYNHEVGVYDSYRDAMGMTMLRRGETDLNTTDPKLITQAGDDLKQLTNLVSVQTTINGAYNGIPTGQFQLHQAWSGDMVGAWSYTPKPLMSEYETLGYWYPQDRKGNVDNDLITVPSSSQNPVLGHLFLNFMLEFKNAMDNFSWVGYQPPQIKADPETLTTTNSIQGQPYVFPWMKDAVTREEDFKHGYTEDELTPAVDQLYHTAWSDFKSG